MLHRSFFLILALSLSAHAKPAAQTKAPIPHPIPAKLKKEMQTKLAIDEAQLLAVDECIFLVQAYNPQEAKRSYPAFCLYDHVEKKGIYEARACIGALVEPDSQTKNPFYGSSGNWGLEGRCSKTEIAKKFQKVKESDAVNPITSFRMKRSEGHRLRLLRDDLGLWTQFDRFTSPIKK